MTSARRKCRTLSSLRRPPAALLAIGVFAALGPDVRLVSADVQVQGNAAQVDLRATAAPLTEVLDRIARQTGMKVEYDGPAPRPLVTLTIKGRSPTEAVLAVFEGLGVNYAMTTDPTGTRVQTLMVAGTAAASAGSSSALPSRRPFSRPAAPEPADVPFEDAEPPPEDIPYSDVPPSDPNTGTAPPEAEAQPGQPGAAPAPAPEQQEPASPYPQGIPYAPGPFEQNEPPEAQPGPTQPQQPAPVPTAPPGQRPGGPPQ